MSALEIIVAIVLIALFYPWIQLIVSYIATVIPMYLLQFVLIAFAIKIVLFIIHRGSEG